MQATHRLPGQREALARQDVSFPAAGLIPGNPCSFEAICAMPPACCGPPDLGITTRPVRYVTELGVPNRRAQVACASGCRFCCHRSG